MSKKRKVPANSDSDGEWSPDGDVAGVPPVTPAKTKCTHVDGDVDGLRRSAPADQHSRGPARKKKRQRCQSSTGAPSDASAAAGELAEGESSVAALHAQRLAGGRARAQQWSADGTGAGEEVEQLFTHIAAAARARGQGVTPARPLISSPADDGTTAKIAVYDGLQLITDHLCAARVYDCVEADVGVSNTAFDVVSITKSGSCDSRTPFGPGKFQVGSAAHGVSPLLAVLINELLVAKLVDGRSLLRQNYGATVILYPSYPRLLDRAAGPPGISPHRDQGTEHDAAKVAAGGGRTDALRADSLLVCVPQDKDDIKSLEHYRVRKDRIGRIIHSISLHANTCHCHSAVLLLRSAYSACFR